MKYKYVLYCEICDCEIIVNNAGEMFDYMKDHRCPRCNCSYEAIVFTKED